MPGKAILKILLSALFGTLLCSSCIATDREKVEEGRYALLKNGNLVAGTEHDWTVWRLPDNHLELEDNFHESPDMLDALIAGAASRNKNLVSPELRGIVDNKVLRSSLVIEYGPERKPIALTVKGRYLTQTKILELLKCDIRPGVAKCSGKDGKVELKLQEPREMLYSYPLPVLLQPWIEDAVANAPNHGPRKIFTVTDKGKLELERADLTVTDLGPDTLTLGNKQFHARKFTVAVKPEITQSVVLTFWVDARATVLAAQVPGREDEMLALVQYKRYLEPAAH